MRRILAATALIYMGSHTSLQAQEKQWANNGVCYEIFVRSFYDSDGDGIGDINGLTQKLDYVNDGNPASKTSLGANCIWLMPVAQSPSYHGYDVTNYYEVNRDYGTTADFKRFMSEAHKRGIRVLVDMVLNHTSSDHPWFQSAALDSASPYRDWYIWSPVQKTNPNWGAPIWHHAPYRNEYYYGLFWSGMPDLNLSNPAVKAETQKIARYWLTEMGVDGFRLDAAAHFIESGDTVMNASGNNPWLREYEAGVKGISPNAFTIGEVTYESPDVIARYYPDQLDSYFSFPIANALIDAVRTGSAAKLMPALADADHRFPAGRWSPFLRNHDQTRTMTELKSDFARAKLAAGLLLTLPGFPFVYYGEEIGMTGNKPDPRLRTPMHWKRAANVGFTTGAPWEPLQADSMTANVEAQEGDSTSLLNTYRALIHLRANNPAIGSGDFIPLATGNDGVAAWLRTNGSRNVLVVANLTGQPQAVVIATPTHAISQGRYAARLLYGSSPAGSLRVTGSGAIQKWTGLAALKPLSLAIVELSKQ